MFCLLANENIMTVYFWLYYLHRKENCDEFCDEFWMQFLPYCEISGSKEFHLGGSLASISLRVG